MGSPTVPEKETDQETVNLVQVDAVVTNSRDEPVPDFVILQDGNPQEITNFSFIRTVDSTVPTKKVHVAEGKTLRLAKWQAHR